MTAAIRPDDLVLEPSAGTGLLAIWAEQTWDPILRSRVGKSAEGELAGARLVLNELAEARAGLLVRLFPACVVTRHDAEAIHDRLDAAVRPSVVLMNPPFSARQNVEGRSAEVAMRHVASALARPRAGRAACGRHRGEPVA